MDAVQPGTSCARLAARAASRSHVVRRATPGILRKASARLRPMRPQPMMAKPVGREEEALGEDIDGVYPGLVRTEMSSLGVEKSF